MNPRDGRAFPAYLFGGRIRTSTVTLIVVFLLTWWVYENYEPAAGPPPQVPASEVVPPGFIPDPAYTWAPRTDVQPRTTLTTTPTTPTTTTSTTPTTPTTPTSGEETPTSGAESPPPASPGASPTTTAPPAPALPGLPTPTLTAPPAPTPGPAPATATPPVPTP